MKAEADLPSLPVYPVDYRFLTPSTGLPDGRTFLPVFHNIVQIFFSVVLSITEMFCHPTSISHDSLLRLNPDSVSGTGITTCVKLCVSGLNLTSRLYSLVANP